MDGEPVPGTYAAEDELFGLGRAMAAGGRAVFELAPQGAAGEDLVAPKKELDWMQRLGAEIDRPVSFALIQVDADPKLWREQLDISAAAHERRQPSFIRRSLPDRSACCSASPVTTPSPTAPPTVG